MQSNYNMEHELETVVTMEPVPYARDNGVAVLQNGASYAAVHGLPASVAAEDDDLGSSLYHQAAFPAIPGGNSADDAVHPIAILQPALARSASAQSSQTLVFNTNRSMSDLANNPTYNITLEYGLGGGHPARAQPSTMQHYRAGRYRAAFEGFVSRQRTYISIMTFVVMFGMTVAGLWLAVVEPHQTLV